MYNKIFIFSVLTTPFLSAMQKTDKQPPYIDHNQPPISQCPTIQITVIFSRDSDSIYSTRAANNDTSSNDSIHTYLVLSDDSQYSDDDEMPICMQCSNSTIPFNTRNNNNTRNNKKNTQYNKTKTGHPQTQTYDFDTDDYNSNNNFDGSRSGFRKNNNFDNSNNNFDGSRSGFRKNNNFDNSNNNFGGSRSGFRKNNDANNNFNNNDYNNMGIADLIRLSGVRR